MPNDNSSVSGGGGSGWSSEQKAMANVIIKVGRQVGASRRDIRIALMTALQESGLRNLDYGDRDSLGLFQQRTSMDWGSREQVTNPYYAARAFFLGAGTNSGLLDIKGRNKMSLSQAAQAVQRSAYPDAYAKWADDALTFISGLPSKGKKYGQPGSPGTPNIAPDPSRMFPTASIADIIGNPDDFGTAMPTAVRQPGDGMTPIATPVAQGLDASTAPTVFTGMAPFNTADEYVAATGGGGFGQRGVNNTRKALVQYARTALGTPYVWGGNDMQKGVDCSGFVQQVYKEMGIDVPRVSYQQAQSGKRVDLSKLRPGDLVAWDNSSRNNGADHIAIYIGNGRIIEAPRTGLSVRIRKLGDNEGAWGVRMKI